MAAERKHFLRNIAGYAATFGGGFAGGYLVQGIETHQFVNPFTFVSNAVEGHYDWPTAGGAALGAILVGGLLHLKHRNDVAKNRIIEANRQAWTTMTEDSHRRKQIVSDNIDRPWFV